MNKKGIAPIGIIVFIALFILTIYLLLYIPLPFFKATRVTINYFLLVISFVLFQIGILYGYYHVGKFTNSVFQRYKKEISNVTFRLKNFLIFK